MSCYATDPNTQTAIFSTTKPQYFLVLVNCNNLGCAHLIVGTVSLEFQVRNWNIWEYRTRDCQTERGIVLWALEQ